MFLFVKCRRATKATHMDTPCPNKTLFRSGVKVLDTMAIEYFISVPYTDSPKLVAALEQHVKDYDVDVMDLQRATKRVPADEPGGYITVELANGASLKSRSVVLSTGARWLHMNVPGEDESDRKSVEEGKGV